MPCAGRSSAEEFGGDPGRFARTGWGLQDDGSTRGHLGNQRSEALLDRKFVMRRRWWLFQGGSDGDGLRGERVFAKVLADR